MMKQALILLGAMLFSCFVSGQNWNPFNQSSYRYFYLTKDGERHRLGIKNQQVDTVGNEIVITPDSFKIFGDNLLYQENGRYFYGMIDTIEIDSRSFFKRIKMTSTGFWMDFGKWYYFRFSPKVGETWPTDSSGNQAEATWVGEESFLDITDSVVVYQCPFGSLKLSKKHGIVLLHNDSLKLKLELRGIRGQVGFEPKVEEYCGYVKKDSFETREYNWHSRGNGGSETYYRRYLITDVDTTPFGFAYKTIVRKAKMVGAPHTRTEIFRYGSTRDTVYCALPTAAHIPGQVVGGVLFLDSAIESGIEGDLVACPVHLNGYPPEGKFQTTYRKSFGRTWSESKEEDIGWYSFGRGWSLYAGVANGKSHGVFRSDSLFYTPKKTYGTSSLDFNTLITDLQWLNRSTASLALFDLEGKEVWRMDGPEFLQDLWFSHVAYQSVRNVGGVIEPNRHFILRLTVLDDFGETRTYSELFCRFE